MKIILKYIFTNVKERKMRTAVMLLSILLSTTLLFVSFSIGASYESAQRKMARGMAGSATISVAAVDGGIKAEALPELPSIRASVRLVEGSALYHEKGYYETIDLIAADLAELFEINPPRLVSGGEVTNFTGNQVILPDRFTSKYGTQKGDMVTLQIGGEPFSFQVAEIAAYDTVFLRHTRGATALLPLPTLSEILGQTDGYTEILVEPAEGVTTAELKEALYGAVLGNEGRLAARNMRDNKNITQNITLLFISISAVIAITVVGNFVTAYVGDVFRDAELQGFADGRMETEFVEQVKDMEGIEKVLPLYVYKNQMQADGTTLSRLEATDNLDWYNSMMALHYTDKDMEEQALSAFAGGRAILLSESGLTRTGFSVGDTVTLTGRAGQWRNSIRMRCLRWAPFCSPCTA